MKELRRCSRCTAIGDEINIVRYPAENLNLCPVCLRRYLIETNMTWLLKDKEGRE